MVAVVERAAIRMQAMLDDLLVFTRTRLSDALPLRLEPVDLHALVAEAAAELRCSFPAIELDLQLIGPLAGSWDRRRVLQLLINLLVNAARYGDGRILLGAHAGSGRLTITVFNTGRPIPPDLLPTLFDPLTRSRLPSRDGHAAGIGLGLYICKSIAHAHGAKSTSSRLVEAPPSP
ncbi:sensor histidine kinase KdpD [Burkholderia sp. Bp8998]|uniref:sensor histidine kinase n=1 Tax=Burkholderia sp. Bp8998 TaxID=2184557 RepID=UPI0016398027|nr:HAMP domain-containing sensor histidine kinase [Burkholderia sp. Bp8998]